MKLKLYILHKEGFCNAFHFINRKFHDRKNISTKNQNYLSF